MSDTMFDTEGMASKKMDISLENILPSLAKALYGEDWRITIRELLQNCHDALVEVQARSEVAQGEMLRVDIIPDPGQGTLTFKDNGMGMTTEEVEKHMATVGAGYKRKELQQMAAEGKVDRHAVDKLIGQYGIGFLSCFIIADRVLVVTQSRTPDVAGVRALFTGETRWFVTDESAAEPGTQVILHLKREPIADPATGKKIDIASLLNSQTLKNEVRRFGDLLPFPINVHREPTDSTGDQCNVLTGPWELGVFNPQQSLDFLDKRHPGENQPLAMFPFRLHRNADKVEAHGVLYVPRGDNARGPDDSAARVELFCRRMFITDNIQPLLPDWATFVGAVIECPDLTPTLSRNDVIRYDPPFVALKQGLGKKIGEVLAETAAKQAKLFSDIVGEHRRRLYVALLMDFRDTPKGEETFFRSIINYIPFMVIHRGAPAGQMMNLLQYRSEFGRRSEEKSDSSKIRIYYLDAAPSLGQIRAMIIQRDIPVIQALDPGESQLLRAYGNAFSEDVVVEDVCGILDLYVEQVDQEPYEAVKRYLQSLMDGPEEVWARRFEPSYMPSIMFSQGKRDPDHANVLQRILEEGGSVLTPRIKRVFEEEIKGATEGKVTNTIILNDANPVVAMIRDHCVRGNPLSGVFANVLLEIYHIAQAYADPRIAESPGYFEHLNELLKTVLEGDAINVKLRTERDQLALSMKNAQQELAELRTGTGEMCPCECAMLLTDLKGSTRMVGFLDREESAKVLQDYAQGIKKRVEGSGGRVEKFTGDGIFAYFEAGSRSAAEAVAAARDCAIEVLQFTTSYFSSDEVQNTLLQAAITIDGSRTVLHYGTAMLGGIAGTRALVGKTVVALFRACGQDDLFGNYPVIISDPFRVMLNLPGHLQPVKENVDLDRCLPQMTFYPHPVLV